MLDRDALFEDNREWAAKIARTWTRRNLPPSFDEKDMEQEARIECWKRAQAYEETRGIPFQAYAYLYVVNAVRMACRRRNWSEAVMPEVDPNTPDDRPIGELAIEMEIERVARDEQIEQRRTLVETALAALPAADAHVVRRVCDGVDVAEIASTWHEEPGKVKRRLSLATRAIKRSLAPPPALPAQEPPPPAAPVHYHGAEVLGLLRARFSGMSPAASATAPADSATCAKPAKPRKPAKRAPQPAAPVTIPAIAERVQERDKQPAEPSHSAPRTVPTNQTTPERIDPMRQHYAAVLADLEKMKADAENGILALRRLLSRDSSETTPASAPPTASGHARAARSQPAAGAETSMSARIFDFLKANPASTYSLAEISTDLGLAGNVSLRSALTRLAATGRISKPSPGRYRALAQASERRPSPGVEASTAAVL